MIKMLQADKTNIELGRQVEDHLKKLGLNTPTIDNGLSVDKKMKIIEKHVKAILETLGMDLTDDSLAETPKRVAKMYVKEIFSGLLVENFPKATVIENKMTTGKEFVLERNISVYSSCEHHLLPILSKVSIAYIPKNNVIGLSKMHRLCKHYAKRPQVQERLTFQIQAALQFILETDDVAVYIDGVHTCVSTRGVEDVTSSTVTLAAGGVFNTNDILRGEFLAEARKA
jgi:GTP cyclohydrolase I